jgi:hypothetical protein
MLLSPKERQRNLLLHRPVEPAEIFGDWWDNQASTTLRKLLRSDHLHKSAESNDVIL